MKMFSCFGNCLSLSKKKKEPIFIGGHEFSYHEQTRRGRTYECNGCQERGFGPYYSPTSGSNFHYHKRCGEILRLQSPFIPNHHPYPVGRYIFEERAPSKVRYCIACGDQVRRLRYKVLSSNPVRRLDYCAFHPLCTEFPPQIQAPGGERVMLKLEERIRGQCAICKGKAKGWAYNSTCRNYSCHVGCMKNKIIQSWQQDEAASENGGNRRRITIHLGIQLPQILELLAAAIRLIIEVLFGVPIPNVADIIIV